MHHFRAEIHQLNQLIYAAQLYLKFAGILFCGGFCVLDLKIFVELILVHQFDYSSHVWMNLLEVWDWIAVSMFKIYFFALDTYLVLVNGSRNLETILKYLQGSPQFLANAIPNLLFQLLLEQRIDVDAVFEQHTITPVKFWTIYDLNVTLVIATNIIIIIHA